MLRFLEVEIVKKKGSLLNYCCFNLYNYSLINRGETAIVVLSDCLSRVRFVSVPCFFLCI